MNLIKTSHRKDFGNQLYVQILNTGRHFPKFIRNYSLIQISVSWDDYPSKPYLQISFGSSGVLSVLFWIYKFGFNTDILTKTWSWDYLEGLGENGNIH